MKNLFLITGANGFVGKQILRALSAQGYSSRLVIRKNSIIKFDSNLLIESIVETDDLFKETEEWWIKTLQKVDTIVHAAWYAEPGKYLTSPLNTSCLMGSLRLFKTATEVGVQKIIGIGTCFEYDSTYQTLSIETPLKPETAYARSKVALFYSLHDLASASGINYNWCRLFYLYGENEDERKLVAYIHSKLKQGQPVELTSGNQIRDYLDVAEAGKIIADVALQSSYSGPVNVCSGIPISVKQLALQIAANYQGERLLHFGKRPDNLTDPNYIVGVKTPINFFT